MTRPICKRRTGITIIMRAYVPHCYLANASHTLKNGPRGTGAKLSRSSGPPQGSATRPPRLRRFLKVISRRQKSRLARTAPRLRPDQYFVRAVRFPRIFKLHIRGCHSHSKRTLVTRYCLPNNSLLLPHR